MSYVVKPGASTKRPPDPQPQYANETAEKLAEKLQLGRLREQNHRLKEENAGLLDKNKNLVATLDIYRRQLSQLQQLQQDNAEMADQLADAEEKQAKFIKLEVALETTESALRKAQAENAELREANSKFAAYRDESVEHMAAHISSLVEENQRLKRALSQRTADDALSHDLGVKVKDQAEEIEALKAELVKAKDVLELADKALMESKTAENHLTNEIRELRHQLDEANTNYAHLSSRYEYEMAQAAHNMRDTVERHKVYDDKMHADNHALADELAAAQRKITELQEMVRSSIENPAIITTPWGNKPISSEGMRFLLDKAIYYHRKYHALEGAHIRLVKRAEGATHCLTDPHFPDHIKLQGEE